jgi:hypothetical protein
LTTPNAIPESFVITDGNARRPEDGFYLHGFTCNNEHVSVQIRQSDIPDLAYPGRLFFNHQLVEVRSPEEAAILAMLKSAVFGDKLNDSGTGTVTYNPGPITEKRSLERIRDSIVAYVESDRFIEIARDGVRPAVPPWKRWGMGN